MEGEKGQGKGEDQEGLRPGKRRSFLFLESKRRVIRGEYGLIVNESRPKGWTLAIT